MLIRIDCQEINFLVCVGNVELSPCCFEKSYEDSLVVQKKGKLRSIFINDTRLCKTILSILFVQQFNNRLCQHDFSNCTKKTARKIKSGKGKTCVSKRI